LCQALLFKRLRRRAPVPKESIKQRIFGVIAGAEIGAKNAAFCMIAESNRPRTARRMMLHFGTVRVLRRRS
jgi:hypothetical protein